MNIVISLFRLLGLLIIIIGSLTLIYFPLALIASYRKHPAPVFNSRRPLVSIIVPAYNEEKVIANCVESILASDYRNIEVVLVDDGSTDNTYMVMQRYQHLPRVIALTKPNGGKASALRMARSSCL
jgi:cellulose synthase/poly-beta-1,6-N-acetylglucosamine synthase-like glycosyltransferase